MAAPGYRQSEKLFKGIEEDNMRAVRETLGPHLKAERIQELLATKNHDGFTPLLLAGYMA